jgi:hypothetical protein
MERRHLHAVTAVRAWIRRRKSRAARWTTIVLTNQPGKIAAIVQTGWAVAITSNTAGTLTTLAHTLACASSRKFPPACKSTLFGTCMTITSDTAAHSVAARRTVVRS